MNLKDIVCDLEYAKKLEKLGVNRKSIFVYWCGGSEIHKLDNDLIDIYADVDGKIPRDIYSYAYTTDELMEMLPSNLDGVNWIVVDKTSKGNFRAMYEFSERENLFSYTDEKLSNALAQLLIWCIEQGHVKVEEVNDGR